MRAGHVNARRTQVLGDAEAGAVLVSRIRNF